MRLLLTRPAPDAERSAARLRARGHQVLVAPLLRIETFDADFGPGPFSAAIITSANAARAVARHPAKASLVDLPLFAVGRHSAEAARSAGFNTIVTANGDAEALVHLVAKRLAKAKDPLLYLAGEDRAQDMAAALSVHKLPVRTVVVYRAVAEERLAPDVHEALAAGHVAGVLHYSRRSAATLISVAGSEGLSSCVIACEHYCLSAEVAAPLLAAGAQKLKIATSPDEESLFSLLTSQ
jgi:uroporphyrinogen-III synthase